MVYKCLQVLNISVNELIRDLVLIVNTVCMSLAMACNFILIRFHKELPIVAIPTLVTFIILSPMILLLVQSKLAQCFELSKGFHSSWNRSLVLSSLDRRMLLKYVKSCRFMRYNTGPFGFYQKSGTTRLIHKIIFYTAKVLVMTK